VPERENIITDVDPQSVRRIHLLGVCGTGMGAFAGTLAALGYEVTGSDENLYPPMSHVLEASGVRTFKGYRPENLTEARPDLVIVGNVIRRVNPEAAAVRERGLAHMSFPAALGALCIRDRHGVVVVGTHGKTTTTALMGHVLVSAGRDPSFLVGGVTLNTGTSFRVGRGDHFAVEGDEYDTAYFDKGPKFLHYRPRTAILTSLELDHADIYRDLAHYRSAFEKFLSLLPRDGYVAACARYPDAVSLARAACPRAETYTSGREPATWQADEIIHGEAGTYFDVVREGKKVQRVLLPVGGPHNVENALGVVAAASALGLSLAEIAGGVATFNGVKRRQEVRGEPGGVLVIDDFAHHPTAVRETLVSIRSRFPQRPVWAIFEPRSNTSRRSLHHADYARAFFGATRVILMTPQPTDQVPEDERLDVGRLAEDISRDGSPAQTVSSVAEIVATVASQATRGELLLVMSNGPFGGVVEKLVAALSERKNR
jgi:UDP-N-acetylmuramate: L-alanyl-gamma-D-glutamyl-meso-diaminopimelate ligase